MQFELFKQTYSELVAKNRLHLVIELILAVALLISVIALINKPVWVHIKPMIDTQEYQFSSQTAEPNYIKAFALSVSELIGNLTPANADFVVKSMGLYFSPEMFTKLQQITEKEANDIKEEGSVTKFIPGAVFYETGTRKTFVIGKFTYFNEDNKRVEKSRVYEYLITFKQGRATIVDFDVYFGLPLTQEYLAVHKGGNHE